MRAVTRRVYDLCVRVLSWTAAHPDDEPGSTVLVAQLQALATRLAQVITDQRNGLIDSRASRSRKQEQRRTMLAVPIAHLAQIGALAARERHELGKSFRFKPTAESLVAFRSAARAMHEEAQSHKEVLVKHGLSESVLVEFGTVLDEFDAAVLLGTEGRMTHTAATRELDALTTEAGRLVRAMDARNRIRFRKRPAGAGAVDQCADGAGDSAGVSGGGGAGGGRWDAGCGRRGEARGVSRGWLAWRRVVGDAADIPTVGGALFSADGAHHRVQGAEAAPRTPGLRARRGSLQLRFSGLAKLGRQA